MKTRNVIDLGVTKYSSISRKELDALTKKSIKKWHFEKVDGGVIPVSD